MKSFILLLFLTVSSCRKGPGVGGQATIGGQVYEYNYNSDFTKILDSYFKGEQDVYIVYGDDKVYTDRFRTHHDGTFEFSYLLPGEYTVFTYSEDKTNSTTAPILVQQKVEISNRNEQVITDTLIIYR